MKKILLLFTTLLVTFSGFINVYAAVNQNGNGANNRNPGTGTDTCTVNKQFCYRGAAVAIVAYRLTFVYAKNGTYKLVPNANDPTQNSDSVDYWSEGWDEGYYYTREKYITGYGHRSKYQASKIEYTTSSVPLVLISNSRNKSTYVKGKHWVYDNGLNQFIKNYSGVKIMEYFSGTETSEYVELVELAKKMNVIKATDNINNLAARATDSSGYVLKLLIEPIGYYMYGPSNSFTGGFFTPTEIAMIMQGKVSGYSVKTNDLNRSTCIFPLRAYLVEDDEELGFDAYTGSTNCNNVGAINTNYIFNNLGVMVVDLSDLFPQDCKIVYRTISLSNPFPGHDGMNTREIGANWYDGTYDIINEYIKNNRGVAADNVYDLNPLYKIVLTPALIKSIRNYNDTAVGGYNNNSLYDCDIFGENCKSKFIQIDYNSSFTGCKINGTC